MLYLFIILAIFTSLIFIHALFKVLFINETESDMRCSNACDTAFRKLCIMANYWLYDRMP